VAGRRKVNDWPARVILQALLSKLGPSDAPDWALPPSLSAFLRPRFNFPPEALCEVEEIQTPEKEKAVTLVTL
jgi:hypothetical protein